MWIWKLGIHREREDEKEKEKEREPEGMVVEVGKGTPIALFSGKKFMEVVFFFLNITEPCSLETRMAYPQHPYDFFF